MIRFWYPSREYEALKPEIDAALNDVQSRGAYILQKDLEDFERDFATLVGTKYAVGLASGTDALYLSLILAGIKPGDEIITTSYTFRATVDAILHLGATPILTDIHENWEDYATEKTKAIIPVHIAGEVESWLPKGEIKMIEDACQALGAAPINGLTACYSFYPAKILGCHGDGGAIATNNKDLADRLKLMRHHFKGSDDFPGYNSRLDNMQAAILNVKLLHLPDFLRRRKEIAMRYDRELKNFLKIPTERYVYQDYIVETKDAAGLHDFLQETDIQTMTNEYVFPRIVQKKQKCVEFERNSLRLPCTPYHTDQEIDQVIQGIKDYYSQRV